MAALPRLNRINLIFIFICLLLPIRAELFFDRYCVPWYIGKISGVSMQQPWRNRRNQLTRANNARLGTKLTVPKKVPEKKRRGLAILAYKADAEILNLARSQPTKCNIQAHYGNKKPTSLKANPHTIYKQLQQSFLRDAQNFRSSVHLFSQTILQLPANQQPAYVEIDTILCAAQQEYNQLIGALLHKLQGLNRQNEKNSKKRAQKIFKDLQSAKL